MPGTRPSALCDTAALGCEYTNVEQDIVASVYSQWRHGLTII